MGVLQTALLLGSSSPLAKTGRDPSLLPFGRTHRPGSPAVPCPGVPPARPAPCPHRPNCHPPARARVTSISTLLLLSPRRTHRLPGLSFLALSHPSLPEDPESCIPARPRPVRPAPTLQPPLLTCLSSWVLSRMAARATSPRRRSPEGLKTKFGTPVPHSHSDTDTPLRLHPADPQAPHEPPEALSRAPSTVNGKNLTSGTPQDSTGWNSLFFAPPLAPLASAPPLWDDRGMRTGSRLFLARGRG